MDILCCRRSAEENVFEYFISYGKASRDYPNFFTPNLIKANLRDKLGGYSKAKLEKHYRRKLESGHSFKVTVTFLVSKQK